MPNIAIITARGGSKRIPKKNIKDFLGKPIIAYSIEAALESGIFAEVMVSTDDEEIADISKYYGAKVPFYRSEKASDDYATTSDVISEVLDEYMQRGNIFEWLCCIYPTAPFVTGQKLRECMEQIIQEGADSLIPVVAFSYPPQRAFIFSSEHTLQYKWPENVNKRSQDLERLYHDAGQFYFAKIACFLKDKNLLGNKNIPLFLSELEAQDIDNPDDWLIAEVKYKIMRQKFGL